MTKDKNNEKIVMIRIGAESDGSLTTIAPMDIEDTPIKEETEQLTNSLRNDPSTYWAHLRRELEGKGLDITTSILVDLFEDGEEIDFGVDLAKTGEEFIFDYGFEKRFNRGEIIRWEKRMMMTTPNQRFKLIRRYAAPNLSGR